MGVWHVQELAQEGLLCQSRDGACRDRIVRLILFVEVALVVVLPAWREPAVTYGTQPGRPPISWFGGSLPVANGNEWGEAVMKILLVSPPMDGKQSPTRHTESLGMGYITAVLRRDGHEVEMFDAYLRRKELKDTISDILSREFDCIGITAYDVHRENLLTIAREVRRHRKDAIICAGGYLPTFMAEKILVACPEFDFLVRGEGELTASQVFRQISEGHDFRNVPGIAYLDNGSPVLNPLPPLIEDLDTLPFPARDELASISPKVPALISGSRGCYHRCAFCSIHGFYGLHGGRAPRYRSPSNILDEIERVIAQTGIREFVFSDDNFIGPGQRNRQRILNMIEEMKSRRLGFTFTIECRVDEADEDLLKALKEVGLTRVFLGVESGVQRQLDTYNKRITVEQSRRAIEMLRRLGIDIYAGLILLDPYVTFGELLENIQFVREMRLENGAGRLPVVCTNKLRLYGGVPMIERLREEGLLREKGLELDYVFKDPTFRFVYRITDSIGRFLRLFNPNA